MLHRRIPRIALWLAAYAAGSTLTYAETGRNLPAGLPEPVQATARATPPTVLFLCPHGAAKSVLASAYFERAARERGLNVRVMSGGTDPDPQIAPRVVDHLTRNGYQISSAKPRRVSAADLSSADVIISIGCDLSALPAPRNTLIKWDDVPPPSEDFASADEKIRQRVTALVEQMLREQRR